MPSAAAVNAAASFTWSKSISNAGVPYNYGESVQNQYNLAADGHRQPGSTFKAIDLADALSRGIDPNTTYYLSHTLAPGWLPGW